MTRLLIDECAEEEVQELEDIPRPEMSDAEVLAAADGMTQPIAEACADILNTHQDESAVADVGASDAVNVDDLADEFEDTDF